MFAQLKDDLLKALMAAATPAAPAAPAARMDEADISAAVSARLKAIRLYESTTGQSADESATELELLRAAAKTRVDVADDASRDWLLGVLSAPKVPQVISAGSAVKVDSAAMTAPVARETVSEQLLKSWAEKQKS